jgi:hypothetical protein
VVAAEAEALVRRSMAIYEKVLGGRERVCAVLHRWPTSWKVKSATRRRVAAPTCATIREKVFASRPETAWSLHSLGYNLYYQSKYAEAERCSDAPWKSAAGAQAGPPGLAHL